MAIELISKIKPKNNGNFKLVDAQDVEYNGKGLDEAIASGEFKGDKGDRGDIGPMGPTGPTGPKGDNGNDGFSPTVSVAEDVDGVTVTVQNKDGAQTAKVKNGKDYEHSEEFTTLAEQVRADKESVEQSKTSVEQTVAQAEGKIDTAGTIAIQGVQNEGTTQTEKVTVEGTKQITEIQSKGEEILHSFPQDFPTQMATKLDKQQGTEHVGKALVIGEDGNVVPGEVQSGGGDGIAIVNTLSGASPLVITDSSDRVIKGFGLTGKTDQMQTTGKNLFDFSNLESGRINISTGALEEHNHTRRLADYINITDITSYSIYLPGYNKANGAVYVVIYYYDKDKNYLSYKPCGDKIEKYENITPVENAVYIKVTLEQNTIDNPQNIFKVQLEKGAKSTDYEPYTGGKPSPSPEYPQEIKNSGKWNEEKQKYEVDVKISNKNLFDLKRIKNGFVKSTGNGFDIVEDNMYPKSIYLDIIIPLKAGQTLNISGVEQDVCRIRVKHDTGNYYLKYTANKYTEIIICFYGGLTDENKKTILIEISDTPTNYEPYKEQTLTLTSDRPITKWDRLVEQGGQIGWLYQSAINEYRGDTTIAIYETGFYLLLNNKKLKSGEGYCEELKQHVPRDEKPCISFSMSTNTYAYTLNTQAIYGSTVSAIKEYLKTHPLHLVYKTETTEFIPLPQEEQNAIRAMTTYYPSTTLTNDQGCTMELDYVADPKNFILGQIGNLQKSLVNTQIQLL